MNRFRYELSHFMAYSAKCTLNSFIWWIFIDAFALLFANAGAIFADISIFYLYIYYIYIMSYNAQRNLADLQAEIGIIHQDRLLLLRNTLLAYCTTFYTHRIRSKVMSIINATRLLESHEIAHQRPDRSIMLASSPVVFFLPFAFHRFLYLQNDAQRLVDSL